MFAMVAAAAAVLLIAALIGGFSRVAPGELAVADSPLFRSSAGRLRPGWSWRPPLLWRTYRYPPEPTLEWEGVVEHPDGREGARVKVAASLDLRLDPAAVTSFHRLLGPDWRASLTAELERQARLALESVEAPLGTGRDRARERVTQRVGGVLDRAGAVATRFEISLTAWQQVAESPAPGRILLVGLDGLDWRLADPLMEQGRLPHLQSLVDRGIRAKFRSMSPMLSPVIWTSMATGVPPERHGILDFVAPGPDGKPIPVTSNLRRIPALWNILSEAGMSVGFVAWWGTWPAEPVNGVIVSDRLAYTLFGLDRAAGPPTEALFHPPGLAAELVPLKVDPTDITVRDLQRFVHLPGDRFPTGADDLQRIDEARRSLAATGTYEAVALHLLRTRSFRLFAVYFEAPDVMCHLFMPFRPPQREGVSDERFGMFRDAVDETYVHHDEILGRLLAEVDLEETTVVVVSDHGFRTDLHRPVGDARIGHGQAAEWHRKFGVLVMAGPPLRRGERVTEAGILDLPPTLMALLGLPAAEDWPGRVLEEAFMPAFLQEHPPRRVDTYGVLGPEGERLALSSQADEALLETLTALGYLTPGGTQASAPGPQGPRTPGSFNNEGSSLMSAGRFREAGKAFRRALEIEPDFLPARSNLGLVLMMQGRLEDAREELERAHRQEPRRPGLMNLLGSLAGNLGEAEESEGWFRKALEIDPNHTDALNSLGILLEEQGRLEEASAIYRRAVTVDPDFALGWNNLGNVAKGRGLRRDAESHYRRAIEADPAFIGPYNNLGLLLQEDSDFERAVQLYEEALERLPGHLEVRNNLASLYHQMGRYDEAAAEYRHLIQESPRYAEAYNNLGVLYGEMGDKQAEIEQYRRAIEVRPDYADALHNLGLALLKAGRTEEAGERLAQALEAEPGHLSARRNLAILEMQRGRAAEALQALEEGLRLSPRSAALHSLRGLVLAQLGRTAEACAALERSQALEPDQPDVRRAREDLGCGAERDRSAPGR